MSQPGKSVDEGYKSSSPVPLIEQNKPIAGGNTRSDIRPSVITVTANGISSDRITSRKLGALKAGRKINVYVGERPNLNQVFASYPIGVLMHYAPSLKNGLKQSSGFNKVIILPALRKAAVAEFLRYALLRGNISKQNSYILDKAKKPAAKYTAPEVDEALDRLRVLLTLGHAGEVTTTHIKLVRQLIVGGFIPWNHLEWLYEPEAPGTIHDVAISLVEQIFLSIMRCHMTKSLPGARSNPIFCEAMMKHVQDIRTNQRIKELQSGKGKPLSIFQVQFIYAFSKPSWRVRHTVCCGLANIMKTQESSILNYGAYVDFGAQNPVFNDDMEAVVTSLEAYLKRERKRAVRGPKQSTKQETQKSAIKNDIANKADKVTQVGSDVLRSVSKAKSTAPKTPAIPAASGTAAVEGAEKDKQEDNNANKKNNSKNKPKQVKTDTTKYPQGVLKASNSKHGGTRRGGRRRPKRDIEIEPTSAAPSQATVEPPLAKRLKLAVTLDVKADGSVVRTAPSNKKPAKSSGL